MIRTPEELEAKYEHPDPWGYRTNPHDIERKRRILAAIEKAAPGRVFKRALDIGAGEGWITGDLPADRIEAIEASDKAAERFPENVRRVLCPIGRYDLILATGVLYDYYDAGTFHKWIRTYARGLVVTCHISEAEIPIPHWAAREERFLYRNKVQRLAAHWVNV